jgi:hypothetical protein
MRLEEAASQSSFGFQIYVTSPIEFKVGRGSVLGMRNKGRGVSLWENGE